MCCCFYFLSSSNMSNTIANVGEVRILRGNNELEFGSDVYK